MKQANKQTSHITRTHTDVQTHVRYPGTPLTHTPGHPPTLVPYPTLPRYPWSRPPPSPPSSTPRHNLSSLPFLFVHYSRFIYFLSRPSFANSGFHYYMILIMAFHYRMFYVALSNGLEYRYGILYITLFTAIIFAYMTQILTYF